MVYQIPAHAIMIAVPGSLSKIRVVKGFGIWHDLILATGCKGLESLREGGIKKGSRGRLSPLGGTLPSWTIRLDVSGRKRTMASRQHGEIADKNQNMALHPHLCSNSPLITGPILGGVFSTNDTRPEYPPRSEGVNRSPITPYVTAYDPEIPALWAIRRKKRRPNELCNARPTFAAT